MRMLFLCGLQMKYKVPPFYKRCLSFLGFSADEQNHMEEITIENGMSVDPEICYACQVKIYLVGEWI